jgi:hypothetical protein
VAWAEPNFVAEYRRSAVPNDPRFGEQWHLRNTEQKGGLAGADIQAVEAWDIETGSPDVVIAIIDDGVEVGHEDLAENIFVNPGEVAGNGVDDDENGYVDDVRGWDFFANDNGALPTASSDNHGTAVAGIAAARGGNGIGATGACQRCRILPVRIFNADHAASSDRIAEAIRYAAGRADIINNSWGGGAPSNAINAAIDFATTAGREGRGTVVVSAAGNESGGIARLFINGLPPGTHRFRWTFSKDDTVSAGDDAAWVATVDFPGFPTLSFDTGVLPPAWTSGGDAGWTQVVDPLHADEGVCSLTALRSNPIGHSQSTYVEALRALPGGTFASTVFVSSEAGYDGLKVQIDLHNDGTINFETGLRRSSSGDPVDRRATPPSPSPIRASSALSWSRNRPKPRCSPSDQAPSRAWRDLPGVVGHTSTRALQLSRRSIAG